MANQLQRVPGSFATEMAMANYLAWRSNGELNDEQFQRVGKTGQRNKAVSSYQSDVAETHWQRKLISPWRAKSR